MIDNRKIAGLNQTNEISSNFDNTEQFPVTSDSQTLTGFLVLPTGYSTSPYNLFTGMSSTTGYIKLDSQLTSKISGKYRISKYTIDTRNGVITNKQITSGPYDFEVTLNSSDNQTFEIELTSDSRYHAAFTLQYNEGKYTVEYDETLCQGYLEKNSAAFTADASAIEIFQTNLSITS